MYTWLVNNQRVEKDSSCKATAWTLLSSCFILLPTGNRCAICCFLLVAISTALNNKLLCLGPDLSILDFVCWFPPVIEDLANLYGSHIPFLPSAVIDCKFVLLSALSSVQFSRSVMSDSLQPHEPQHARPPCPSPTPRVYPNPCPLSRWCHATISSSVVPFSSCPQSCPASGTFQISQLYASVGQSIGVSASTSVLPMNTQDWSPLGWIAWISLQSKGT